LQRGGDVAADWIEQNGPSCGDTTRLDFDCRMWSSPTTVVRELNLGPGLKAKKETYAGILQDWQVFVQEYVNIQARRL
jgi:hypothetical protein